MAPNPPGPPPPPPPPNSRGAPPPPPGVRPPGPPPGPQPFPPPMRNNSTRFVDITPRIPLGEDECAKKLTTYEAHTIRKIVPPDSKKVKSTWAKSEVTKESLAPEEVSKQVKKLGERGRSLTEKKQALQPFQQRQVNNLLDDLNSAERDPHFEYNLVQLDQKIRPLKTGQRETTTITCYVKRSPRKDVNPVGIYNALERQKSERMAALNRPPQQPQQPPPQQQGQPQGQLRGDGPVMVKLGPGDRDQRDRDPKDPRGRQSKLPRPKKRSDKRYHHDDRSSVSSGFTSDTDSGSDYSSSDGTSISSYTASDRHQRRHSNHKSRHQNRGRAHNEHRRSQYLIDDVIHSPGDRIRDSFHGGPIPQYVPDVPRGIPSVPAIDPVAAAYQAGKIDADAERFGLDRIPRIRPFAAERAVISYGRPEPRYIEPRYEPRPVDIRYVDEFDDMRGPDPRYRDAEDYIERRNEPRFDYHPRRTSEPHRVIYTNPNPFAPTRRYAPSHDSSGW